MRVGAERPLRSASSQQLINGSSQTISKEI